MTVLAPNPAARPREARWEAVYAVLLLGIMGLVAVILLFSKAFFGWYARPPLFAVFRLLSFLQLGCFVAMLIGLAAWISRRLPAVLRIVLVLPGVLCAGWIVVWAIVHAGFGIRLSVPQVVDLVTSPESLTVTGLAPTQVAIQTAILCGLAAGLAVAIQAAAARCRPRFVRRTALFATAAFLSLHVAVRGYMGYHAARNQRAVLMLDEGIPLPLRTEAWLLGAGRSRLQFPRLAEPKRTAAYFNWSRQAPAPAVPRKLSILWISIDSFRSDAIADSTMPYLFAHRDEFQLRREQDHWSAANMTRGGIFSMLTGLSAYHLQSARAARLSFPLLSLLAQDGYRLRIAKGLSFYYGELRAFLPPQAIVAEIRAPSNPAGDRAMVDSLVTDLESRDPSRPAFDLLTFDATHWPYDYPGMERTTEPSTRPDRIYRAARSESTVRASRVRYANSLRFEDAEIARVLERLRASGGLARTIVVITGDHGEEFLERGQLGHGSGINDYQARVPLWIRFPGDARVPPPLGLSSSLDIVATLLDCLGFDRDVLRTQGRSLLRHGPPPVMLMVAEQGWAEPAYHALISSTYISRWRESGGQFLFSSVERRDGAAVSDSAWWREVTAGRPTAAAGYEVLPDVHAPSRAFAEPDPALAQLDRSPPGLREPTRPPARESSRGPRELPEAAAAAPTRARRR